VSAAALPAGPQAAGAREIPDLVAAIGDVLTMVGAVERLPPALGELRRLHVPAAGAMTKQAPGVRAEASEQVAPPHIKGDAHVPAVGVRVEASPTIPCACGEVLITETRDPSRVPLGDASGSANAAAGSDNAPLTGELRMGEATQVGVQLPADNCATKPALTKA